MWLFNTLIQAYQAQINHKEIRQLEIWLRNKFYRLLFYIDKNTLESFYSSQYVNKYNKILIIVILCKSNFLKICLIHLIDFSNYSKWINFIIRFVCPSRKLKLKVYDIFNKILQTDIKV